MTEIVYFHFFLVPQKEKNLLIKLFLVWFHKYLKYGNMKLAFTNAPCRHNSAGIIQKWLRLKRLIIVRLGYISLIFPNGCKII